MNLHGYTRDSITRLATRASVDHRTRAVPFQERYEIAWSAIAEALVVADVAPSVRDLILVGERSISDHVRALMRDRGIRQDRGAMPRFAAYWTPGTRTPLDERVIERVALTQILATLTPARRAALEALAEHEDYRPAAESLGLRRTAFDGRLQLARRDVVSLWHEGETPRPRARDARRRKPDRLSVAVLVRPFTYLPEERAS